MQDVEADVGEGVAEVPGVVRGHAADVEAHPVTAGDRLERVQAAAAGIVQAEGHAADSKAGLRASAVRGLDVTDRIGARMGVLLPQSTESEPIMEVLRWLLFFAIAMFLIVAGIFFVLGRPLPIPSF